MIFSVDFLTTENMKDRKHFRDQIDRNPFDLILTRRDWRCSNLVNLRCLNFAVNEINQ